MSFQTVTVEGQCKQGGVTIFSLIPFHMKHLASVLQYAGTQDEGIDVLIGECRLCIRYGWEFGRAYLDGKSIIFSTNRVDVVTVADILQEIADDYPTAPETAFPHLHLEPSLLNGTFQVGDIVFEPVGIREGVS